MQINLIISNYNYLFIKVFLYSEIKSIKAVALLDMEVLKRFRSFRTKYNSLYKIIVNNEVDATGNESKSKYILI